MSWKRVCGSDRCKEREWGATGRQQVEDRQWKGWPGKDLNGSECVEEKAKSWEWEGSEESGGERRRWKAIGRSLCARSLSYFIKRCLLRCAALT